MQIVHRIPEPALWLGVVEARGVDPLHYPEGFEEALEGLLAHRKMPLTPEEEVRRKRVRDMLRRGRYKPTGRGKPASEYLLRAAQTGSFPRINAPVDINNLVSLRYMLPISLWDVEKAGTEAYTFRLGQAGEAYVFNPSGQTIDLEDLVVGAACYGEVSRPIVNPVRDALQTKTDTQTSHVVGVIYAPEEEREVLEEALQTMARWLEDTGPSVRVVAHVMKPGEVWAW